VSALKERAVSELGLRTVEMLVYAGTILEDDQQVGSVNNLKPGHFIVALEVREDVPEDVEDQTAVVTWTCPIDMHVNDDKEDFCAICNGPHPTRVVNTNQSAVLKCPGNHELKHHSTPRAGFFCDKCERKGLPKGSSMFGCRTCDWDACETCYMETMESTLHCPGHHSLNRFETNQPSFFCDNCAGAERKPLPLGSVMYGCRVCDWDACERCFKSSFRPKTKTNTDRKDRKTRPNPRPAPGPSGPGQMDLLGMMMSRFGIPPEARDQFVDKLAQDQGIALQEGGDRAQFEQSVVAQLQRELLSMQGGGGMPGGGGPGCPMQ
jgi:hypothetical protein